MTNERELTVDVASELDIVEDVLAILSVLDFSQIESITYWDYVVTVDPIEYRVYIEFYTEEVVSLYIPIERVGILQKELEDHLALLEGLQRTDHILLPE
jgi:hypothetical protein